MDDFTHVAGPDSGARQGNESVLIARGKSIVEMPADVWKGHVAAAIDRISARLAFMTPDHHKVRRFVVAEIARRSRPITEAQIGRQLKLPAERVHQILGELESRLFFLVRDSRGAVSWAYPFTSDQTSHKVIRRSRRPARAA